MYAGWGWHERAGRSQKVLERDQHQLWTCIVITWAPKRGREMSTTHIHTHIYITAAIPLLRGTQPYSRRRRSQPSPAFSTSLLLGYTAPKSPSTAMGSPTPLAKMYSAKSCSQLPSCGHRAERQRRHAPLLCTSALLAPAQPDRPPQLVREAGSARPRQIKNVALSVDVGTLVANLCDGGRTTAERHLAVLGCRCRPRTGSTHRGGRVAVRKVDVTGWPHRPLRRVPRRAPRRTVRHAAGGMLEPSFLGSLPPSYVHPQKRHSAYRLYLSPPGIECGGGVRTQAKVPNVPSRL
jgi:hypothetical protein